MATASTTVISSLPPRAKNRAEILLVIEQVRLSAGELMREVFPGSLKQYALPYLPASTLSKARLAYFCGPLFRAALCIVALRVGGAPREKAQRLVDWLQALVNKLWPAEETAATPITQLVRKEQENDSKEDVAETEFLIALAEGDQPRAAVARREYRRLIEERQALDHTLLLALADA